MFTIRLDSNSTTGSSWNRARWQDHFMAVSGSRNVYAVLLVSALFLILYGQVFRSMVQQWWDDPNYGHGFLVPAFAAYILWRERGRRREIAIHESNWGLPIMFAAIGMLLLGILGSEHFTARFSALILISGIVVFVAGWQALRSVSFPMAYLIFMIPLPAIIYYQLTFPLQILASRLGESGLVALGVRAVREGNLLILPNCTLEVVEACSGVRSLLSLVAVVVGYVYLVEPAIWKRCILIALTIPIVIASNGLRLVSAGLLSFLIGPETDSGVVHAGLGLIVFVLAFLSIVLIHRLLRRLTAKHVLVPAN
jgi:exosortase